MASSLSLAPLASIDRWQGQERGWTIPSGLKLTRKLIYVNKAHDASCMAK